ncbi:hypothetical protein CKO_03030 [Citrobacter koseri ATCC BAA-895]|uniref:Uncharacterized protein n=1 Tax=Citrobacter koseri (strain ATCC BAA-895 / CDC 4225-83 / SGSC4696) TaxID=290338 RepID=A8AKV9_CITK8|nr:hypothetical protein CKO_03030 [Citrobacter koseri ATCC BAA-895]
MSESFHMPYLALYQRTNLICLFSFVNDCLQAVCAPAPQKSTTIIGLKARECYHRVYFMYKNR